MQPPCIYCKAKNIVKNGSRKTKQRGNVPLFKCKKCKRTFCKDDGFKWKHHSKEKIIDALELYVGGGVSSRFLAQFLFISKNTVIRWVLEYCGKICRFTGKFKLQINLKTHVDELFLKMLAKFCYLWDAICAENRFAFMHFSENRGNKDAEELLKQILNSYMLVFDGAFQYPSVLKKLLGVWWYYHHTHRCKNFEDKKNNNLIERFQNFIRSKTHQRRGFKSVKTGATQLQMLLIYYNFIRVHSAIGKTPAEAAGFVEYWGKETERKRWLYLIEQASNMPVFILMMVSTVL